MPNKRNLILLVLIGIASGMIPLLMGSTLFVWLKENGLNIQTIGLYSLTNLPIAFSFALSAGLEYCSYKKYFSYKWIMIIALLIASSAIFYLPQAIHRPYLLALNCVILSLAASIVRIIMLALQKILFPQHYLVWIINLSTISYKLGIILGGSLALFFSQTLAWATIYHGFALLSLIFTLLITLFPAKLFDLGNHLDTQNPTLWQRITKPFINLWAIPQIGLILALMFFYRAPDNLITHYFDLFYLHFGFTKTNIAFGYKLYGMLVASLGGLFCIKLIAKYDYFNCLNLALVAHLGSYLLIYGLSQAHLSLWGFYLGVTIEEFSRGMTMIVFWSFQTYICQRQHILIQLAVLTAIDSFSYSILSALAGSLINYFGYANFVGCVILSFIPAFIIIRQLKTAPALK
jgi:PAT family beta-lactamase induction signal transducer AmpG